MRIVLLGAGGFHPSERRHTACVMLPELGLVIDAGTGAFRVARHVATPTLDVLLSHAHLDHTVGISFLFGLELEGAPVDVTVHASSATLEAVRGALLDKRLFPIEPVARYAPLGPELRHASGARVTTFPLEHPGGSLGMRVEHGGKSLAYVSDTTAVGPATLDAIRGVDLLLHEAYCTERQAELARVSGHSTARQAAEAARAAGAGRMVLIHRDPRAEDDSTALNEARAVFAATDVAEDGMDITL